MKALIKAVVLLLLFGTVSVKPLLAQSPEDYEELRQLAIARFDASGLKKMSLPLQANVFFVNPEWAYGGVEYYGPGGGIAARYLAHLANGNWKIEFEPTQTFEELVKQFPDGLDDDLKNNYLLGIQSRMSVLSLSTSQHFQLPFGVSDEWYLTQGPHNQDAGHAEQAPLSALDLQNNTNGHSGEVRAAQSGTVTLGCFTDYNGNHNNEPEEANLIIISHTGDAQGYHTGYYHIRNRDSNGNPIVTNNQTVTRGQYIAESSNATGCYYIAGMAVHLHFTLRQGNLNNYIPWQDHVLSGWEVDPDSENPDYDGPIKMTLNGSTTTKSAYALIKNYGFGAGNCSWIQYDDVILFEHKSCQVNSSMTRAAEPGLTIDLEEDVFNDKASSIYIPQGKSAKVWRDYNTTTNRPYGANQCVTWTRDLSGIWIDNDGNPGNNAKNDSISYVETFNSTDCTSGGTCVDPAALKVESTSFDLGVQNICANPVPPGTPGNMRVTGTTQDDISLAWNNVGGESGYRVYRYNGSSYVQYRTLGANVTSFTDSGVSCSSPTKYYRVVSYNQYGESSASNSVSAKTDACTPSPSDKAKIYTVSGYNGTVIWSGGLEFSNGPGSTPQYSLKLPSGWSAWLYKADNKGGEKRCFWYSIDNLESHGWQNQIQSIEMFDSDVCPKKPATPKNLEVIAKTDTTVTLRWDDMSDDETNFEVYWIESGSLVKIKDLSANTEQTSITGLDCDSLKSYYVRAYNTAGSSGYSNRVSGKTEACNHPPVAPSGLTEVSSTDTSVTFGWTDNSDDETKFIIYKWSGYTWLSEPDVGANVTQFTDNGLKCEADYWYKMYASNAYGDSAFTPYIQLRTSVCPAVLNAVGNLQQVGRTGTTVTLSWVDNSFKEDSYELVRWNNGTAVWDNVGSVGQDQSSISDTGLICESTYQYRVYPTESVQGDGPFVEISATTAQCPAPDPPQNVWAATTHDLVGIAWDAVAGADDYYVYKWMDVGAGNWTWNWLGPRGGATNYTDTDVTCATTYYYYVVAINGFQSDPAPNPYLEATTYACPIPLAPENLRVVAQDPYQITVRWDDLSSNEDEFIIYRSQFIDGSWQVVELTRVGAGVTEFNDTNVVCGDFHYVYRVAASNAAGRSDKTERLDVSTDFCPDGEIAPMVTNLVATAVNAYIIELSWIDNASDELFYIITRRESTSDDEGVVGYTDENVNTFTDAGAVCGYTYEYFVQVSNIYGRSIKTSVFIDHLCSSTLHDIYLPFVVKQ